MTARCLLIALSLLLLSGSAHGQATGRVGFTGTWEEAVAEAQVRNVPIVIFFLLQNDEDGSFDENEMSTPVEFQRIEFGESVLYRQVKRKPGEGQPRANPCSGLRRVS